MADDEREWDDPPGVWDGDDGEEDDGSTATADGETPRSREEREPLTPSEISTEHATFVLLGAALATVVLFQLTNGVL